MEKWMKEISINDLDEKNREIAEIIGLENTLKLAKYYGGTVVYFNKLDEMIKPARNKLIIKEYGRLSIRELARKYNLAEDSIRRIIRDDILDNQISIFD